MRGIHRSPVNSLHKGPVTRKMLPFDDLIMYILHIACDDFLIPILPSFVMPCYKAKTWGSFTNGFAVAIQSQGKYYFGIIRPFLNEMIAMNVCRWHDSSAVVACAKGLSDIRNAIKIRRNVLQIWKRHYPAWYVMPITVCLEQDDCRQSSHLDLTCGKQKIQ